jgi:TrmH family RNA methyltransferase
LPGIEIEPELLTSASGLASGTRTLAVYEERFSERALGPLCVYVHALQDPGNVGTLLRSAEAFGASSVALGAGSADPFNPKAVRASMGAVFTVPLVLVDDPGDLPGVKVALVPGRGVPIGELSRSGRVYENQIAKVQDLSLLVGAERMGLPDDVVERADLVAHIPTANDSLNAAMAATVALYELATKGLSR